MKAMKVSGTNLVHASRELES